MATSRSDGEQRLTVIQGEYRISSSSSVVLSTLLGSCVSLCLHDPIASLGGMNHFLLPGTDIDEQDGHLLRYGASAMEVLVNGLLTKGAKRPQLRAKLFGGARVLAGLTDLGSRNADFAEQYLRRENIALVGGSLRGDRGRRVEFWPTTGRTRQLLIGGALAAHRYPPPPVDVGAVELF